MMIGMRKESNAEVLNAPMIDKTESVYPRNIAPVSPIKIFAGFALYGKKPRHAPHSAAVRRAVCVSERSMAIMSRETELMVLTRRQARQARQ